MLSEETRYRLFIDRMINDISVLAEDIFDADHDPEVIWSVFRRELQKLKKEHSQRYGLYMESEDETEFPESEISKWRRENPDYI